MQTTFQFDPTNNIGIDKLRCVECNKPLKLLSPKKLVCGNKHWFKVVNNIPILLSKHSNLTLLQSLTTSSGETMKDEYELSQKAILKQIVKKLTTVPNISMEMFDSEMLFNRLTDNDNPRVFVVSIGGGPARDRKTIVNLNIDTYPNVEIVGDAHHLPFKDNSVDGVVINAVLEHLEHPQIAVNEIFRVLKKGGYVLAETPFLQHYHGYPFHFQTYTLTGHNFLFRQFTILQSGAVGGPFGTAATLLSNIPEDLITNKYIRKLVLYVLGICLLPMRMLDIFFKNNPNIFKITTGVYLFAQK
jgi:SAM-dependent methyltransferase